MTKTLEKTLTQRVTALEAENKKLRKKLAKIYKRLDVLECDEIPLPPTLTPEEREQQEALDKWHRIGVWE